MCWTALDVHLDVYTYNTCWCIQFQIDNPRQLGAKSSSTAWYKKPHHDKERLMLRVDVDSWPLYSWHHTCTAPTEAPSKPVEVFAWVEEEELDSLAMDVPWHTEDPGTLYRLGTIREP